MRASMQPPPAPLLLTSLSLDFALLLGTVSGLTLPVRGLSLCHFLETSNENSINIQAEA